MFNCVKRKKLKVTDMSSRDFVKKDDQKNPQVGLVIGHNKKKQGAVNYLGESEYSFNKRIARKVQIKLRSAFIDSLVIERIVGSYSSQCKAVAKLCNENNGIKIALHLHFNSAGARVLGCEVLIAPTASKIDVELADLITDKLNEKYGFRERGDDGIVRISKGHNGFKMLNAVKSTGVIPVLLEPCFGNVRTRESALIFEQEDRYVNILVESIIKIIRL